MKSSKNFLLCLLAGLFITANCGAVPGVEKNDTAKENQTTLTPVQPTTVESDTSTASVTILPNDDTTTPGNTTTPPPDTTTSKNTTTPPPDTTTPTTSVPPDTTTPTTTIAPNTTSSSSTSSSTTTTTTPAPTTSTTEIPNNSTTTTTTPAPPAPIPCRRFDGPSFIGGIVLTLGLLAICLVAYKFYKARNERNYHTL